jgi:hypothetical protein
MSGYVKRAVSVDKIDGQEFAVTTFVGGLIAGKFGKKMMEAAD